jgi:hypothetical protein
MKTYLVLLGSICVFFILVGNVAAQSCTGVYRCGEYPTEGTCSLGGAVCDCNTYGCGTNGAGTCQGCGGCQPTTPANSNCSGSNQSSCNNPGCAECAEINYCSWDGGPGAPTPTPGGGGGGGGGVGEVIVKLKVGVDTTGDNISDLSLYTDYGPQWCTTGHTKGRAFSFAMEMQPGTCSNDTADSWWYYYAYHNACVFDNWGNSPGTYFIWGSNCTVAPYGSPRRYYFNGTELSQDFNVVGYGGDGGCVVDPKSWTENRVCLGGTWLR